MCYLFGHLFVLVLKQPLFSFGQGTEHVLRQHLLGIFVLEINVEARVLSQLEAVVTLVRLLQLQQQMSLLALVLRLFEHLVVVFLILILLAAATAAGRL